MTLPLARTALLASIAAMVGCATPTGPAQRGPPPARSPAAEGAVERAHGQYGPEPAFAASTLEVSILEALRAARHEGARLQASPALSAAARDLARAAATGVPAPLAPSRIRDALARGAAFDPSPRAYAVDAPAGAAPETIVTSIAAQPADSHAGVGAVTVHDRIHVVVLLTARLATLDPFPRETAPGQRATLRGRLLTLAQPSVHLTTPSGESRTATLRRDGARFEAPLLFDVPGRWTVEVVGEGAHGPQVAALLTISCGGAPLEAKPVEDPPDPDDPRKAEARVVAAISRIRARQGVPPLEDSAPLAEVARRHSEAMLRAGILAHRLDGTDGAADRLRRARVPFAVVLENVAKGPSALSAHRLAEESPAHRQNILSPEVTRVGVGIARGALPGGEPIVYLTELFTRVAGDPDDDPLTLEGRVREAIWRERARIGAPPLRSDPQLDELARVAAHEMLRRGEPDPGDLPLRALSLGRATAAADAFVAATPADAVRSRNLGDPRFNRVGVSVAYGETARYGAGLLWIAVIYTD